MSRVQMTSRNDYVREVPVHRTMVSQQFYSNFKKYIKIALATSVKSNSNINDHQAITL